MTIITMSALAWGLLALGAYTLIEYRAAIYQAEQRAKRKQRLDE